MRIYGIGERPLIGSTTRMRACLSRERGGDFSFSLKQSDRCISCVFRDPPCGPGDAAESRIRCANYRVARRASYRFTSATGRCV